MPSDKLIYDYKTTDVNVSYLVTDAATDEKITGRFKLIRHGEKKINLKGKQDSCQEGMSTLSVTC